MNDFIDSNGEFYLHEDPEIDALIRDFIVNHSMKDIPSVINAENLDRFQSICMELLGYIRENELDIEPRILFGNIFNLNGIVEFSIPDFGFNAEDKAIILGILEKADSLSTGSTDDGLVNVCIEVRNVFDPVRS